MEQLKIGEMATLEDGREYIVFYECSLDEVDYIYLMSNFKPLEILFATQKIDDQGVSLAIVTDIEIKKKLLEVLQNAKMNNETI